MGYAVKYKVHKKIIQNMTSIIFPSADLTDIAVLDCLHAYCAAYL